jgi:hypothetical protein
MNRTGGGKKRSWPNLRYHPIISCGVLRRNTKNLSQDTGSPGRDINLGPPEYEAGSFFKAYVNVYY